MNSKLERTVLHARALAAVVLHLLMHGHDVRDELGDLVWSTPVDTTANRHYEIRLLPDHRFAAHSVSAGSTREVRHFDMLEAAIMQIIEWREQCNGCRVSHYDVDHVTLAVHV